MHNKNAMKMRKKTETFTVKSQRQKISQMFI
jgi:hypothetical protein